MPTYQYACTECDHRFDAVQSFSDPSLTVCPECGGKLRKVFSSVGIVFKGSGFYKTDSRSGSRKSSTSSGEKASSDKGAPDKGSSSSETSSNGSGSSSKEPAASSPSKSDAS